MRKLLKQLSIKLTDYQHGKPADQMTQLSQFKPQNKNKLKLKEPVRINVISLVGNALFVI